MLYWYLPVNNHIVNEIRLDVQCMGPVKLYNCRTGIHYTGFMQSCVFDVVNKNVVKST